MEYDNKYPHETDCDERYIHGKKPSTTYSVKRARKIQEAMKRSEPLTIDKRILIFNKVKKKEGER